jgi:hypothetical protein
MFDNPLKHFTNFHLKTILSSLNLIEKSIFCGPIQMLQEVTHKLSKIAKKINFVSISEMENSLSKFFHKFIDIEIKLPPNLLVDYFRKTKKLKQTCSIENALLITDEKNIRKNA